MYSWITIEEDWVSAQWEIIDGGGYFNTMYGECYMLRNISEMNI